jgi:hypothetical protein
VTGVDWNTGKPLAKYWVTQLLATTVGGKQNKTVFANMVSFNGSTWQRNASRVCDGHSSAPMQCGWAGKERPLYVLAYLDHKTNRRGILLVNKRKIPMSVHLGNVTGGTALSLEVATEGSASDEPGYQPAVEKTVPPQGVIELGPFAIAVVSHIKHKSDDDDETDRPLHLDGNRDRTRRLNLPGLRAPRSQQVTV